MGANKVCQPGFPTLWATEFNFQWTVVEHSQCFCISFDRAKFSSAYAPARPSEYRHIQPTFLQQFPGHDEHPDRWSGPSQETDAPKWIRVAERAGHFGVALSAIRAAGEGLVDADGIAKVNAWADGQVLTGRQRDIKSTLRLDKIDIGRDTVGSSAQTWKRNGFAAPVAEWSWKRPKPVNWRLCKTNRRDGARQREAKLANQRFELAAESIQRYTSWSQAPSRAGAQRSSRPGHGHDWSKDSGVRGVKI